MRAIVILTSCFLFMTCKKEEPRSEWETFDFDIFTVEAPSEWHKFTGRGYDSKVGGITNKKDTIHYDYGMYSSRFSTITSETHIITESNRDGYPTKMVKPKKPGDGVIGIYYDLGNALRLTVYSHNSKEHTTSQIIESIKVK